MPVDFNAPEGTTTPQNDGAMFAPTPIWEQRTKAGRRGRRASRNPAADAQPQSADTAEFSPAPAADGASDSETFRYDPIRSERRRSGVPAGIIAAGVAAIAVIGALGWYVNRPHDTGMPELTPGAPGASEIAIAAPPVNPLPMSAPGAPPGAPMGVTPQVAAISPPREAAPAATARSTEPVARRTERPSRVRPAAASSAQEQGVDAGASAPMIVPPGPQSSAKGPTLDMPPEVIAPHLDPTLPSNSGARAPTPSAPVAGDAATP